MRAIEQRLGRIEELLGASECVCADDSAVEIVIVEYGWDEARIRQVEEAKRVACPVHGLSRTPTLRLAGSDIYG